MNNFISGVTRILARTQNKNLPEKNPLLSHHLTLPITTTICPAPPLPNFLSTFAKKYILSFLFITPDIPNTYYVFTENLSSRLSEHQHIVPHSQIPRRSMSQSQITIPFTLGFQKLRLPQSKPHRHQKLSSYSNEGLLSSIYNNACRVCLTEH